MDDLNKINADRIANLEKTLNDRQQHMYELMGEMKKSNGNGNLWRPALTVGGLLASIAGLFISMLMFFWGGQLETAANRMERIEDRIEHRVTQLDDKLQLELGKSDERNQARLTKLEEWQRWWYRNEMACGLEEGE